MEGPQNCLVLLSPAKPGLESNSYQCPKQNKERQKHQGVCKALEIYRKANITGFWKFIVALSKGRPKKETQYTISGFCRMVLQYHSLCFLSKIVYQPASLFPHQCHSLPSHLILVPSNCVLNCSFTCSLPAHPLRICQLFFLKLWPKSAETSLPCKNNAVAHSQPQSAT